VLADQQLVRYRRARANVKAAPARLAAEVERAAE
jgi:hypothetical protein